MPNRSLLNRRVSMHGFVLFYILLIIIGKIVRWTIMYSTLIAYSKGWGYPNQIINDPFSFEFFGIEEVSEGDIGIGTNDIAILKVFWYLILCIPTSFVGFEIAITIIWGLFLLIVIMYVEPIISMSSFIYISLSTIAISVYDLSLGKEPVQMLYFFLLFAVLTNKHLKEKAKIISGIIVILLSAMTFRTYYILILIFGLAFYLVMIMLKKNSGLNEAKLKRLQLPVILVSMCLAYLIIMTALNIFNGELFVRMKDALLTASAATSSSNTYMDNKIAADDASNLVIITLEYALAVLRMLFPVELLSLGPKYWPYILYQFMMTIFMIKGIKNYRTIGNIQKFAVAVFVGYVFCSACFEVDFGAWVRHNTTTFPLALIVGGIVRVDDICQSKDNNKLCYER